MVYHMTCHMITIIHMISHMTSHMISHMTMGSHDPPLHRMNLYELIKRNNFQGFSTSLIRRFAYSLLHCLRLLRRERIIHCDLKPVR